MQITIKRKILIVLVVWFVCTIFIGVWMLQKINRLGHSIDVIMRENYHSVIICQNVIWSLSELETDIFKNDSSEVSDAESHKEKIEEMQKLWQEEISNATVHNEKELAESTQKHLDDFLQLYQQIYSIEKNQTRLERYNKDVLPMFLTLKEEISNILAINQERMYQADEKARQEAENLFRISVFLLIACFLFLSGFGWLLTRWLQKPLRQLLYMCKTIAGGNFSCVMQAKSHDEIGELMRSFNGMAAFLRTGMMNMEEKLHHSEQISHDILMSMPIPVAVFNKKDGKILFETEVAQEYFLLKQDESILEHGAPWLKQIFEQVRQSGHQETSDELLNCQKAKKNVSFQIHAAPLPAEVKPEDQTVVIVTLMDMTSTLNKRDFESRILSGIYTYFNDMLKNIMLADYVLLDDQCGPITEKQKELLLEIRKSGQSLVDSLAEFVAFNNMSPELGMTCLPKTILLQASERFLPLVAHAEINIETECATELPPVQISEEKLFKFLEQLFSNALRFTPVGGTIQLGARLQGNHVEFSVSNPGPEIPEELKEKVFEPLFRGDTSEDEHRGFGLSMTRAAVRSAGGDIGIRDRVGGGTVVYFTLPIATDAATATTRTPEQNKESLC